MLKPLVRVSLVCLFMALLSGAAFAQQAQPDVYVVVSYIDVQPGQDDAYRAYLTTTGKKLYQEMMTAVPALISWSVARTMYQGTDHGTSFDYVGASVYAGAPPEPGANLDAIYMKATGMSQADWGKKLAAMRTIVGTEVVRRRAGTDSPGVLKEGDFRIVSRLKINQGMGDEFYQMAQSMTQPLMQARTAAGELKSWSLWSSVFPSGAATSYDALAVSYFKDLASAIKGLDGTKGVETFLKVHPGKSFATYISNGGAYTELQQRMIMQVVAMVDRPTTK